MTQFDQIFRNHESLLVVGFMLASLCGLAWILARLDHDEAGRPHIDAIVIQECGWFIAVAGLLEIIVFQTVTAIGIGSLLVAIGSLHGLTFGVLRAVAVCVAALRRI